MRRISEETYKKAYDAYLAKYEKVGKIQGGTKTERPETYAQFKTDLISMRADIARENVERGVRSRPSAVRIAQDLARKDAYYGSFKQGRLYYNVLQRSGYFDNTLRFDPKTGNMVEWKPSRTQFALLFQRGELNEDEYDEAVRANLSEEYAEFKRNYEEKHGISKGVGAAWETHIRTWYTSE